MTEPLQTGIIITDCRDENARVRQQARFMSLFGVNPAFLPVTAPTENLEAAGLQAAGHLVDQLDAATSLPAARPQGRTVVLVNVATRGSHVRGKWDNGTPFCYFEVGPALVVSTYAGAALSLARDLGLVREVQLLDVPEVTGAAVAWGELTPAEADKITHTQFRSLEFLPLVARWIYEGRYVPAVTQSLDEHPEVAGRVWFIDNFGNAKTTLRPDDVNFREGRRVTLDNGQQLVCHRRLTDVPDGVAALTIGSSGYRDQRLLEVVVQRRSAADVLGLTVGQQLSARVYETR